MGCHVTASAAGHGCPDPDCLFCGTDQTKASEAGPAPQRPTYVSTARSPVKEIGRCAGGARSTCTGMAAWGAVPFAARAGDYAGAQRTAESMLDEARG